MTQYFSLKETPVNRFKIPLDGTLVYSNAYLIDAGDESILVDTGINRDGNYETLMEAFRENDFPPENLDALFVTHYHPDHMGLALKLLNDFPELEVLVPANKDETRQTPNDFFVWAEEVGASEAFIERREQLYGFEHPYQDYVDELRDHSLTLKEGAELFVGDFRFEVIGTPGHTPGHLSLFEPELEFLFSGDHLLPNETPNVGIFPGKESSQPLKRYRESLREIRVLEPEAAFPGHGDPFRNVTERINELLLHHDQRLESIGEVVEAGAETVLDVAVRLRWTDDDVRFEDLEGNDQFLALAETYAHAMHLCRQNRLNLDETNRPKRFSAP